MSSALNKFGHPSAQVRPAPHSGPTDRLPTSVVHASMLSATECSDSAVGLYPQLNACRSFKRSPSYRTNGWPKPHRPLVGRAIELRTPALQAAAGCPGKEQPGARRHLPYSWSSTPSRESTSLLSALATSASAETQDAPTSGVRRPRRSIMSGGARPSHEDAEGDVGNVFHSHPIVVTEAARSHPQRVVTPQPQVEL